MQMSSFLYFLLSTGFSGVVSEVRINPILSNDDHNHTRYTTPSIPKEPHFASDSPEEVMAAMGTPAHIPCKARSLGAKSVSWIRHHDLHMLTVGTFSFTSDERFSAHRDPSSGDWLLVIRQPELSDSGLYECSVSTKPVITHTVRLDVVVPSAKLLGPMEVFLDNGSALNLTCVILHTPVPPEFVHWYHRGQPVNYGRESQTVVVETAHTGSTTRSSLLVNNATHRNSGKYTCKSANADSATVSVHVLKSETPAAMQTTNAAGEVDYASSNISIMVALLLLIFVTLSIDNDEKSHQNIRNRIDTDNKLKNILRDRRIRKTCHNNFESYIKI